MWLIPTPELQRARLAAQGTSGGAARLYALLEDVIAREAAQHAVPTLLVDGARSVEETVAVVEGRFADAIVRTFVCECGEAECEVELELPVGAIRRSSAGPDHRR